MTSRIVRLLLVAFLVFGFAVSGRGQQAKPRPRVVVIVVERDPLPGGVGQLERRVER